MSMVRLSKAIEGGDRLIGNERGGRSDGHVLTGCTGVDLGVDTILDIRKLRRGDGQRLCLSRDESKGSEESQCSVSNFNSTRF
jgi:hypothetical protein